MFTHGSADQGGSVHCGPNDQNGLGEVVGRSGRRSFGQTSAEGLSLFVPVTVTLELEWVLRASFGYEKDDVLQALSNLFSAAELTFESECALEVALQLYREGSADFADCLHSALASVAGELPLWTFDQAGAKVIGAQLLRTR